MLRAVVAAVVLATAYCGAKGPPQPPAKEAPDGGPVASSPAPDSGPEAPATRTDAGAP
jgi:predicted small lipoprotein YifL